MSAPATGGTDARRRRLSAPRPTAPGLGAGGCQGGRGASRWCPWSSPPGFRRLDRLRVRSMVPSPVSLGVARGRCRTPPCRLMSRPERSSTAISTWVSPARCRFGRRSTRRSSAMTDSCSPCRLTTPLPANGRCRCGGSHRRRSWFSRTSSPSLHAELRSLLGGHGVGYDPAIEATEYTTIVGLVAAGEGVALVLPRAPTSAPQRGLCEGRRRRRPCRARPSEPDRRAADDRRERDHRTRPNRRSVGLDHRAELARVDAVHDHAVATHVELALHRLGALSG